MDINLYWWRPPSGEFTNFGDEISRDVVSHITGLDVRLATPETANLFALGSILEHIPNDIGIQDYSIWGSGIISNSTSKFSNRPGSVIAVRGLLTYSKLENPVSNIVFGDPGIFVGETYNPKLIRDSDEIGLILHYADADSLSKDDWARLSAFKIINARNKSSEVVAQIASCSAIVSSSLHGLIAADTLGIPSVRLNSENLTGGNFKFDDYQSVLRNSTRLEIDFVDLFEEKLAKVRRSLNACTTPTNLDELRAGLKVRLRDWASTKRDFRGEIKDEHI